MNHQVRLWECPTGAAGIVNESEKIQNSLNAIFEKITGEKNVLPSRSTRFGSNAPIVYVDRASLKEGDVWYLGTNDPECTVALMEDLAADLKKECQPDLITIVVIVMGDQEYDADIHPVIYPGHLTDEQIKKIFSKIMETYKYYDLENTEKKREYDFVGRAYSELHDMVQKENVKMTVYAYRSTFEDPKWCGVVHGGGMIHRKV